MSIELITALLFGSMVALLALGLPIAFAFGSVAVVFTIWLWGPGGLFIVGAKAFDMTSTILLIAVPLFVFMACVLERSGLADDLYTMMHRWLGPLRGGLAAGTDMGSRRLGRESAGWSGDRAPCDSNPAVVSVVATRTTPANLSPPAFS